MAPPRPAATAGSALLSIAAATKPSPLNPYLKTFVSGAGFMSDAYDLFIIDVVKNVMSDLYPQSTAQTTMVSTAALVGAVMGQISFGALADKIGRRAVFMVTLVLVVFASLGSATCSAGGAVDIYTQLAIWRFILGVGVGGEYPLSATITSEGAQTRVRGYAVALVFSMQGVGKILAATINVLCLSSGMSLDAAWRFALGFGAVPGLLTVYHRWRIEESSHFKAIVKADNKVGDAAAESAAAAADADAGLSEARIAGGPGHGAEGKSNPMRLLTADALGSQLDSVLTNIPGVQQTSNFHKTLQTIYEFRYVLAGTAGNWFLLDITFYGQGLFSGTVLKIAGFGGVNEGHSHTQAELLTLALGSLMLVGIAMPGYIVGTALIERMGRRPMQIMGFAICALLFLVLGAGYAPIKAQQGLFVLLYGLTFFFSNFGANLTTFVVPSEAFPTRARATCHGLSAASGKLGAVLGSSGMAPLLTIYGTDSDSKDRGLQLVMYVCCAISALGLLWTIAFLKETGQLDLSLLDAREKAGAAAEDGGGDGNSEIQSLSPVALALEMAPTGGSGGARGAGVALGRGSRAAAVAQASGKLHGEPVW